MSAPRILVAGIGNVFLGDDAFGVEVVRRLACRELPEGVEARDFGIRGYDLAFALDRTDATILVDALSRGGAPGTLYSMEPDLDSLPQTGAADPHAMDPVQVLCLARQLNVMPGRVVVLGCEPESFGDETDGRLGLSPVVADAVGRAVPLLESWISRLRAGEPSSPDDGKFDRINANPKGDVYVHVNVSNGEAESGRP